MVLQEREKKDQSVKYVLRKDICYWEIESLSKLYKKENMEKFANGILK